MRTLIARSALLLALLAAGGLAWLTGHPDSPWLDRAVRWPLVGGWAERFRELYRPPPPPARPAAEGDEIEIVTIWRRERGVSPGAGAAAGEWRFERRPGSSVDHPAAEDGEPPLGRAVVPPGPLPARAADPGRLRAAEALLGAAAWRSALGPYELLADARAEPPRERWSALTAALDAAFAERTGRAPLGAPAETVVLFADEAGYRALQAAEARLAGLATGGHASAGLAALWGSGRTPDEVESTLVHELAHFVTRRAIGPALPPWLDEGLAEDLGQAPFDAARGRFELGGWRVDVERSGDRIQIRGALAALDSAARALDAEPRVTISGLLALEWEDFVGAGAPVRYAQALAWVRFLFDGDDPQSAARFREFLAEIAGGESADGNRLLARLGGEPGELDARFAAWLRAERAGRFAAAGLPPPRPQPSGAPSDSSSRQDSPPSP